MIKKFFRKIKLFFTRKKEVKKVKRLLHPLHYEIALGEIGVKEIAGPKHNNKILLYHAAVAGNFRSDEMPWCASFIAYCLERAGHHSTNSALARSYEIYGRPVNSPKLGDICVFHRKIRHDIFGHVAFYAGEGKGVIFCLGGNQKDEVNITPYSKDRLICYRRGNWKAV